MKKRRDSVVSCSRGLLLFGAAALASAGLGGCDWIQDRFKAKAPEVKFAPYAENYGFKTDFAQVEAQFPRAPRSSRGSRRRIWLRSIRSRSTRSTHV